MDHLHRAWNRYQWVGEPRRGSVGEASFDDIANDARWNLYQWVGDLGGSPQRQWELPPEPDTSGGFSGFGHADSGGQRWATGYRRTEELVVTTPDNEEDESEAVADGGRRGGELGTSS